MMRQWRRTTRVLLAACPAALRLQCVQFIGTLHVACVLYTYIYTISGYVYQCTILALRLHCVQFIGTLNIACVLYIYIYIYDIRICVSRYYISASPPLCAIHRYVARRLCFVVGWCSGKLQWQYIYTCACI